MRAISQQPQQPPPATFSYSTWIPISIAAISAGVAVYNAWRSRQSAKSAKEQAEQSTHQATYANQARLDIGKQLEQANAIAKESLDANRSRDAIRIDYSVSFSSSRVNGNSPHLLLRVINNSTARTITIRAYGFCNVAYRYELSQMPDMLKIPSGQSSEIGLKICNLLADQWAEILADRPSLWIQFEHEKKGHRIRLDFDGKIALQNFYAAIQFDRQLPSNSVSRNSSWMGFTRETADMDASDLSD